MALDRECVGAHGWTSGRTLLGCPGGYQVVGLVGYFDCILVAVVVKGAKVEVAITGAKVGVVTHVSGMITSP